MPVPVVVLAACLAHPNWLRAAATAGNATNSSNPPPTSAPTSSPSPAPTSLPTPPPTTICGAYSSSCSACVGNDEASDQCVWCTQGSQSSCISQFDTSDQQCDMRKTAQSTNPCDADMGTVTFAVCAGALLFFCLCSFLSRRYRNEQYTNNWANSQMRAPLRQEEALRDTMIEMGHQEWECPVCHFSNLPSKVECVMCGAPKGALGERQRSTLTWKQSQQQDAVKDGAGAGDVSGGMHDSGLLAGDHAVGSYSPPVLSTGSGGSRYDVDEGNQSSTSTDAPAQPGSRPINREERQRSFVVRRINKLSQRQKGARRRKQWVRRIDGDGALRWVRNASRRRGSSAGDDEDSLLGSVAADAAAAVASIHSGRAHSNDESCSPTNVVRLNDTFNDDAMLSTSPGFISQFLEDGSVHWNEASAIELGRDGEGGAAAVDWEAVAALSFSQKWTWLLEQLALRQVDWEEGHVKLTVRRENLLADSIAQFNVLPQPHLHRWLRIAFEDEPAIDAGGLEREWFQLCVEGLFATDFGLFSSTHATEAVSYVINPGSPASATARPTPEDHLQWFRFTGRLMGKAIMEQQIIAAHLALPLLKQILGVPITLSDLEFVDAQLHRNLLWMRENTGAEMLCLCFSVTQEEGGQIVEHELIPGGADKEVTDENKDEYISEMLKYRMLTSVSKQLHSFLQGLFEVVPRELLSVFDYQELELLLCGLPDINVQQWSHYTKYEGEFEDQGGGHPVCQWFWQVVTDFSQEDRARLLQFATGTSRVPAQGFRALQSNDGRTRPFTLRSIPVDDNVRAHTLPISHTCFNRIDLPVYDTKDDLEAALTDCINMEVSGFTVE